MRKKGRKRPSSSSSSSSSSIIIIMNTRVHARGRNPRRVLATRCWLLAACCVLPAVRCPLPAAFCLLPAAPCPLPYARCPRAGTRKLGQEAVCACPLGSTSVRVRRLYLLVASSREREPERKSLDNEKAHTLCNERARPISHCLREAGGETVTG